MIDHTARLGKPFYLSDTVSMEYKGLNKDRTVMSFDVRRHLPFGIFPHFIWKQYTMFQPLNPSENSQKFTIENISIYGVHPRPTEMSFYIEGQKIVIFSYAVNRKNVKAQVEVSYNK